MQKLALTNTYNWKNTDKRMQTAWDFFKQNTSGHYLIHKTTRAGCTTAIVASCLNLHERFLIVVPTNAIADKTIIEDAEKYSDRENVNIVRVLSNHSCIINEQKIKDYPDIGKLPILPLADKCGECDYYDQCPITKILREHEVCDGVSLTYHKLAALVMASMTRPGTTAEQVLNAISDMRNVVFDEVHEIQYGRSVTITIYNDYKKEKRINLSKYIPLMDDYENIRRVVTNFSMFLEEPTTANNVHIMYNDALDKDYYKHKLSRTLPNYYSDISKGEDPTKAVMAVYNEIIDLTINRGKYGLSMGDILLIYNMLAIITNDNIVIHGIREKNHAKVQLVAVDNMFTKMVKSFIMSVQNKTKRIMLTSATICSHDYNQYFMNGYTAKNVLFGDGGDPMNTNSKMLILADSKKYHVTGRNARFAQRDDIVTKICTILDMYDDDECIVITLNKLEALQLEKDLDAAGHKHTVTYYKAPEMMGVSAKARVMIAVGVADKPSNAYDAITETKEQSLVLREESMHADTWQAWSRVKDPSGKVPSLVFALGCSVEQCESIVTWGFNRTVTIGEHSERQKKIVNVNCTSTIITKPIVKKCSDFTMMLSECVLHKHCNKIVNSSAKNLLIFNIIRRFSRNELTIFSRSEFLGLFVNRSDVYAKQTDDGSYVKVSEYVTDQLLDMHLYGEVTIGTYALNHENKVRWLCFDVDAHRSADDTDETLKAKQENAEQEKDTICMFLDNANVRYVLESSGTPYSYHIWVFLKPVEAAKAKHFGKRVLQECGIKKMEVFPKQEKLNKNGYGNLVKLPLAINRKNGNKSKIWLNGEWVEDFESITVGAIDISSYTLPEVKKIECQKPDKVEGVRDIFKWALTQSLTGEQGHWMRIAIVREYYNNGTKEPEKLAELFKSQLDYDPEYSYKAVLSIIKDDYGCWKWETIVNRCPDLVKKYNERK